MKDKYHEIGNICIADRVAMLITSQGFEGTEDLINRVLTHPDLAQLKYMFLDELYKWWK